MGALVEAPLGARCVQETDAQRGGARGGALTSSSSFSTTALYFWIMATRFSLFFIISFCSTDCRILQEARLAPTRFL